MIGTVKHYSLERGWGFIRLDNGDPDIFVHATGLADGVGELIAGEKVEFRSGVDRRSGRTYAHSVRPTSTSALQSLRKQVEAELIGRPGANELLTQLRFLISDLEQIAKA